MIISTIGKAAVVGCPTIYTVTQFRLLSLELPKNRIIRILTDKYKAKSSSQYAL